MQPKVFISHASADDGFVAELRQQAQALAVFHGGAQLNILAHVLEVEVDTARTLASALIAVGLAEGQGYSHLHLDPALPSYLLSQLDAAETERLRARWAEGMQDLTEFLYQEQFKDAEGIAHLTQSELPNLLALLEWLQEQVTAEVVVEVAGQVEQLLVALDRSQALAQVVKIRVQAAQSLGDWSNARFAAEYYQIDRMLERGELRVARSATEQFLRRSLEAGEEAYPNAAYHIAIAHALFGRVLRLSGAAAAALVPLAEAQQRFRALVDAGHDDGTPIASIRMASVCAVDQGDCLTDLGRLEEATAMYEEGIARAEKLDDKRQIGVGKIQLGSVRLSQHRYAEALKIYTEARALFTSLGDPGHVATVWYQIGIVHRETKQFDAAEHAYRQSLAITVRQHYRSSKARSLTELGNLYSEMERWEEAVTFYRQTADICVTLQDLSHEGAVHNNLANVLIKLRRYDEARIEVQRAIESKQPFGHVGNLWKTWGVLYDLEVAVGNTQAATAARQQAIDAYLSYRRDGGEPQTLGGKLCEMMTYAIQHREKAKAEQELAKYEGPDAKPWPLLSKLHAVLNGDRNRALADDPELHYTDAAEVRLALERIKN
jgi:tetratricopeptide (TPR) repeat protein